MSRGDTSTNTSTACPLTIDEMSCLESLLDCATEPELKRIEQLLKPPQPPSSTLNAAEIAPPLMPASPLDLARIVWGEQWMSPPHLVTLDRELTKIADKTDESNRLMVAMPPRHGKSLLTSEIFPAWYLGTFPDRRVILASYEADFAATWGRKARSILEEYGQSLFGISVSKDSSAANRWDIAGHRGGMVTAGVGGPITGKGADLLLIDDPVKNAEEANSYTYRQRAWDWYQSTAYTRLEPDGAIVLIQTRWHGDDLAGRVLKDAEREGEPWEVLDLPAIARANDRLGRAPGEALWPERFNETRLRAIRKAVGEYYWAALYQQRPTEDQGGRIKRNWLRYFATQGDYYRLLRPDGSILCLVHPSECQRITIVDCAGSSDDVKREKSGKPHSYSVISTFDFHNSSKTGGVRPTYALILRDVRRGRWEFPELVAQMQSAFREHNPAWIGIENEKTGLAALQVLRGLPVRPISHEGKDKLTRAGRLLNEFEQGRVYIARDAAWRDDLEAELLAWTGHPDEQADQIDTMAYAANHVGRASGGVPIVAGRMMVGGV